jgi:threonine-phosphate decarboxylase
MATYEYSHGGNAAFEAGGGDMLDLSANINPLGMPPGVREAVTAALEQSQSYPDSASTELREAIAAFDHVDPQWVFCAGGASDVIFRLPRAVNARTVMLLAPTFSDYERAALAHGSKALRHTLYPDDGFDLAGGFLDAVRRERPDLTFICSPNNPTGRLTDIGLIGDLLELCRRQGGHVAIDECFMDFALSADAATAKRFLTEYRNLVVLKAFTKTFAMPGIRLGYAISSSPELIDGLYMNGADWPVSNLAQAAGLAALSVATGYIQRSVAFIASQRELLEKGLAALGYGVIRSQANYVFIRSPYRFDLRERLDRLMIRIRSCANYHGLDGSYYRIAVASAESNARLLDAVAQVTGQAGLDGRPSAGEVA